MTIGRWTLFYSQADRHLVRVAIGRRIRGDIVLQELEHASGQAAPMITAHASFPFDWPVLAPAVRGRAAGLDSAAGDSQSFRSSGTPVTWDSPGGRAFTGFYYWLSGLAS
jgi:hypothetical protein